MKEEDLREAAAKGANWDALLNNPLYKNAYKQLDELLWSEFKQTKTGQSEERDEIWRKAQSARFVQSMFERMVRDGDQANRTLLQRAKDKFKSVA